MLVLIVGATFGLATITRYLFEMITNRAMTSISKLGCATLCAAATTIPLMSGEPQEVIAAHVLAALGGATILHRLHRFLGALGDYYRMLVLSGSLRRQLP